MDHGTRPGGMVKLAACKVESEFGDRQPFRSPVMGTGSFLNHKKQPVPYKSSPISRAMAVVHGVPRVAEQEFLSDA
jgi:hypothetical protein